MLPSTFNYTLSKSPSNKIPLVLSCVLVSDLSCAIKIALMLESAPMCNKH